MISMLASRRWYNEPDDYLQERLLFHHALLYYSKNREILRTDEI